MKHTLNPKENLIILLDHLFLGALNKQRKDAGRMAPMPQIGAGKGVPLYIPDYKGTRGEEDKNPSNFAKQTNRSKVEKRYRTNMPIQSGKYKNAIQSNIINK